MYERGVLKNIKKVLFREEFVILSGARQTGKTTVMRLLKNFLEEKGYACWYFTLENPEHLKSFNEHPFTLLDRIPQKKTKQYVFIDEIQHLDDPSNFLKLLFDEKRDRIKIICGGSSSFYIDKKFKDSLAGRKFLFEIYPLNFDEFLTFKQEDDLLAEKKKKLSRYSQDKLLRLWREYVLFGGYPKVVLSEGEELKKAILEEIGTSYIKKDVTDAGIRNEEKYFFLLKLLASQTGQLVNVRELSGLLNMVGKTVDEYVYVMKKSYQIAFIKPFFKSVRKELVKMPKPYFYDVGLRNFFMNDFSDMANRSDGGAYLENIAFREFLYATRNADAIKFWRTQEGKEVDFVVNGSAFEIKMNKKKQERDRYTAFTRQYPDISFSFLTETDIMKKFYGWKM